MHGVKYKNMRSFLLWQVSRVQRENNFDELQRKNLSANEYGFHGRIVSY